MFIYVNKNCLSAYGKIYRRGEMVELDDEVGAALLGSDDFSMVEMDPSQQENVKKEEKDAKRKAVTGAKTKRKGTKEESEEELPVPDLEEAVEK